MIALLIIIRITITNKGFEALILIVMAVLFIRRYISYTISAFGLIRTLFDIGWVVRIKVTLLIFNIIIMIAYIDVARLFEVENN